MKDLREEKLIQDQTQEQAMKTGDTTSVSHVWTVKQDPKENLVQTGNSGMIESRQDHQTETMDDTRSVPSDQSETMGGL